MGVFRQLGDPVCPVCPDCLCQHHGAAYAELTPTYDMHILGAGYDLIPNGATIVQQQITIIERCCIAVNAASITDYTIPETAIEIERPLGTIRTTQEDRILTADFNLLHHAAWEVLDAGTYTYFLVNRAGASINIFAAWLKIIASDCEG